MHSLRPLLIAGLVVTEVGLWQWRMFIAHRGHRLSAMLLGTTGALLQITAISQVVANIHDPLSVTAYAAGVGIGVLLGLLAGERLTPGAVGVTVTSLAPHLARELWRRGWPVTVQNGRGEAGPITVLSVALDRRDQPRLTRDLADLAPDAAWNVRELRLGSVPSARAG